MIGDEQFRTSSIKSQLEYSSLIPWNEFLAFQYHLQKCLQLFHCSDLRRRLPNLLSAQPLWNLFQTSWRPCMIKSSSIFSSCIHPIAMLILTKFAFIIDFCSLGSQLYVLADTSWSFSGQGKNSFNPTVLLTILFPLYMGGTAVCFCSIPASEGV